ncbi:MAG: hypothetical protein OXF56_03200 [Rhodobacteraceae bacterium]|nr:hypothetical protein [Paracoccaceae bacterium]
MTPIQRTGLAGDRSDRASRGMSRPLVSPSGRFVIPAAMTAALFFV